VVTVKLTTSRAMSTPYFEVASSVVQAHARIREHIYKTPLIPARTAGVEHNAKVLFKAEQFQYTGSFKLRGAMSKMTKHSSTGKLITASSGNHGIASSHAAKTFSRDLTVVLPESVAPAKLAKIYSYGVEVIQHGYETGLAEKHAQQLSASGEYTYISPYNDADIVAGQGTIGLEILEQCSEVDNIFISLGGGGLVSGIGSIMKAFNPRTKIWGIAAKNSMALAASIRAGKVVETEHLPTLAEGVAGGMDEDSLTLPIAMSVVDEIVECSEEDIAIALRSLAIEENMIVEGAAALALAGFNHVTPYVTGQTSIIILCGGNVHADDIRTVIYGLEKAKPDFESA